MAQPTTNTEKIIEGQVQTTFKNSPNTMTALKDLATAIPAKLIRTLIGTVLKLYTKILDKMLKTLGIAISDPKKLPEQLSSAKNKIKLFGQLLMDSLKDPEIRKLIQEIATILNDKALRPFLEASTLILNESVPE